MGCCCVRPLDFHSDYRESLILKSKIKITSPRWIFGLCVPSVINASLRFRYMQRDLIVMVELKTQRGAYCAICHDLNRLDTIVTNRKAKFIRMPQESSRFVTQPQRLMLGALLNVGVTSAKITLVVKKSNHQSIYVKKHK